MGADVVGTTGPQIAGAWGQAEGTRGAEGGDHRRPPSPGGGMEGWWRDGRGCRSGREAACRLLFSPNLQQIERAK